MNNYTKAQKEDLETLLDLCKLFLTLYNNVTLLQQQEYCHQAFNKMLSYNFICYSCLHAIFINSNTKACHNRIVSSIGFMATE
jgi:hypothetical protein